MPQPSQTQDIVVDVGGTNTRVALAKDGAVLSATIKRYRNAEYPGLEPVLREYLSAYPDVVPTSGCVAIAGPVHEGRGRLTNRDWSLDSVDLARAIGAERVDLLNDLQAQGYAVDHVAPEDLLEVRAAPPSPEHAPKLVVNLGTGFNASPVFWTAAGPFVATSESGHATMPTRNAQDLRLCAFVEERHGFAAIDDILSGRGLVQIYAFLSHEAGEERVIDSAQIIAGCTDKSDPIAVDCVHYFIRLAALVMGNLAMVQLPFGGIYLVGGLASAVAPFMQDAGFEAALRDKGRFASFMDAFGVHVVQDDYAALKGMAAYLKRNAVG